MVPALHGDYFTQEAALAHNDCGVFRDDWCYLKAEKASPCVFTRNMEQFKLPLRHGEGKFVATPEVMAEIEANNQVALRYCNADGSIATEFPANPNGSTNAIAGICDKTGRIFGLMPHPEAFLSPFNSPDWTRDRANGKVAEEGDGVMIFRNAADYIAENF
jgi:phosphoribosylformylglycinamidine synthase